MDGIIMLLVTNVARALPICVSKDECKSGIWCGDGSGGTCFHFSCQIYMDCRKLVRCNTPGPNCMKAYHYAGHNRCLHPCVPNKV
ncbi:unnamed protein product [Thlaspi arvense]|uniref:Uncharacterized protein n=1 Tax=Thlaspi arvense TaxID=13288 RepID=A0AAU9RC93_THLAR|nr:unnamed protein product [Thlaspi arvense]